MRLNRAKPHAVVIRASKWDTTPAAPRAIEVLHDFGFATTMLCWDRTGQKPKEEIIGHTRILRFHGRYTPQSIRFVMLWPLWWLWITWKLIAGRYNLVHAINLDSIVPVVLARPFLGYKVIYDIRDAWGLSLTDRPFPVPQIFTQMDRILSPMVDGLLLSQGRIDVCAEFFGRRACQKLPVIQLLNVPQHDLGKNHRIPGGKPLRINYSGHITKKRAAMILARAVKDRSDVVMDVIGHIRQDDISNLMKQLPNVTVHGRVPHNKAMELMDKADLVSLLYDPSLKVVYISSANKMFEAMMLAKPYIATRGSYPGGVAERYGLGWAIEYGDADALNGLLDRLVAHPELIAEAGKRGREAYEKHFRWETQRKNLEALYRHVLGVGEPPAMRPSSGWYKVIGAVDAD